MRDNKNFDINIDAGGDFSFSFTIYNEGSTPVDLTNAIVTAKLREYPEGTDEILFTTEHNNEGGQITISLPHETTSAIGYTYGWYEVKVEFVDSSIEEVLHGKAFIVAGVTRLSNVGAINQIVAFPSFDDFPTEGNIYRIYLDQHTYELYWWDSRQYVSLTYAMRGKAATIRIGDVETLLAGSDAFVENVGTDSDAIFHIGIPRGDKGDAGTIRIGEVTTVGPAESATVENVGTPEDAIINFHIPRGYNGFVSYATFEVDFTTGDLVMYSDAEISGANFQITNDGDLVVIV